MADKRKQAATAAKRYQKSEMACNKPQKTPGHPTKSHIVKACDNGKEKLIRFGEQGAEKEGRPKGTRQGQGISSKPNHGRKKTRGQGKG